MITREQLTEIGSITKAHGLHGEMAATLDVDADLLLALRCIVLDMDGIFVPFFVGAARQRGTQAVLLSLDGVDSDRRAAQLTGRTVYALSDDLEQHIDADDGQLDEMPLDYFTGFTIVDDNTGDIVGVINDVDDTTINVLFIVSRPDGSVARVPAADELVTDVDTDRRIITMRLPGGLLDL